MAIEIYHNPNCGTSRNVVKLARDAGLEPRIIEYLKTGWTRELLSALFTAADLTPRAALRAQNSPAEELGLLDPTVDDETILEAMIAHPILVNRPIVRTPHGVALCRPCERLFDLLDPLPAGPLFKENGDMVLTETGERLG